MNPSSDHYLTDAVVPSSDHYCIETVAPSGDHYGIDIVVPSSDHLRHREAKSTVIQTDGDPFECWN